MSVVYQYRVYCIAEATYVTTYDTTAPTLCPNNHPDRSIDANLTSIVKRFSKNIVSAEENTEGDFELVDIRIDVPSGTPGDVTEHDISWDMDILLWHTYLYPSSDMIGDEISVIAFPETQIGILSAPANIGETTLSVDAAVFNYARRGYLITLDDTVNKNVLGRITGLDSGAGTITVKNTTSNAFAAGTPVKISVYILKDVFISGTSVIEIGGKGIRGKNILSGQILRIYYTNNSGAAKTFRWRPEYYNNG